MTLTDPGETLRRRTAALSQLFGLTAAEVSVALAVSAGKTAADIAQERHVAVSTVRTQIRAAVEKTGGHKISELARTVASVP